MPNHMDFFRASSKRVGVIDPGVVVNVANAFLPLVTNLFGGDQVPNYPIKLTSTLNSLKASILEHVGALPPTSVADAQVKLQKAIARKAYEDSIGHGYGDGPGWDTLQMMYDEVIAGLKAYIAAGGQGTVQYGTGSGSQTTLPTGGGYIPMTSQPGGFGRFIQDNPLLVAGAVAGIIYFVTRKKRR